MRRGLALTAILALSLLVGACAGSESVSTPGPSASAATAATDAAESDGTFATRPDGRVELFGQVSGMSEERTAKDPDSTPHPDDADAWELTTITLDFGTPATIDGVRATLELTLDVGAETRVLDASGSGVPRAELPDQLFDEDDWERYWVATLARGENGGLATVELRQVSRWEDRPPRPEVTGLLRPLGGGLFEVPGEPGDQYESRGRDWITLTEPVVLDGVEAVAAFGLAIGPRSRVVTKPPAEGSTDDALTWVSEYGDRHDWRVTARKKGPILVLARLEQL